MKTLIVKLGATGDVVRTTTLLHIINNDVFWLTSRQNLPMLKDIGREIKFYSWEERDNIKKEQYDLIINLEDSFEISLFLKEIKCNSFFGAYIDNFNSIKYTKNSSEWFDLSLISYLGKEEADKLKFQNRKSYQEIIFQGLENNFLGETYFLPPSKKTNLFGDIAISNTSGDVWPMKKWGYYDSLKIKLEDYGYKVNFLPIRKILNEHVFDIQNHNYLIGGDSLSMHIALGSKIKCTSIFLCTSPWEIFSYGLQKKIVSPLLEKYFYKRDFQKDAVESIEIDSVFEVVLNHMKEKGEENENT